MDIYLVVWTLTFILHVGFSAFVIIFVVFSRILNMETRGFDASVTDTTTVTNTTAESPGAVNGPGAAARDKRQKQGRKDGDASRPSKAKPSPLPGLFST